MTSGELDPTPLSRVELRRVALSFVVAASIVATLTGAAIALEMGFGLGKFGGLEYLPRVLALAGARELGAASSAAGALYAFLIWSQAVPAVRLRAQMRRAGPALALLSIPVTAFAVLVFITAGMATACFAYDVSFAMVVSASSGFQASDIPAALVSLLVGLAIASLYCWFAYRQWRRQAGPPRARSP